jgi:hypothetical protein
MVKLQEDGHLARLKKVESGKWKVEKKREPQRGSIIQPRATPWVADKKHSTL